jgi:glycerol-3-phosphate acyltransferase PlsX
MRIVLDAMGSDTHPIPEVQAAVKAVEQWGDPILLAGPEEELRKRIDLYPKSRELVEIIHASQVLEMTDKPARSARGKEENSMAVGMNLVKEGQADVFVTAGNTGGAMATALFRLGRLRGVKRPAVAPLFPVKDGRALVIDIGANTDCKPLFLLQFAQMGALYVERVLGIENPRIGLLSNGEEAGKGNQLVKETYPLLEESGLNFIGNVEPKEVYAGQADVVVTDGFYGNIFLKTSEAVASFLTSIIKEEITSGLVTSMGGLLAKPAFNRVGSMLDPAEYGAAPLLGVDGLVYIGHGRSDDHALFNAIRVARQAVDRGFMQALRDSLSDRLAQEASS